MKICSNCGIELEDHMNYCPVCGEPSIEEGMIEKEKIKVTKNYREDALATDYQKLSSGEKRKLIWEVAGIILLSGMFITSVIDFIANQTISWSGYPVVIGIILFINVTLISFLYRHVLWAVIISWISTSALLLLLDWISRNINWSLELGIPLLTVSYLIIFVLIIVIRRLKKKGLNIVAYVLLAAGLLCLSTEAIISLAFSEKIKLEWSIIVIASVIPTAVFLFILHQRLKRKTDLKRFFHI